MTATRRLLFVLACVVCLIAVASALPAADPRLDTPGGGEPTAGEWDSIDATPEFETEPVDDRAVDDPDDGDDEPHHTIEINGDLEAGNEVTVDIDSATPFNEREIDVDGERVGQTDWGRLDVTVPYTEEMTVDIAGENTSRTVDVETNATITHHDGAAPTQPYEISAAVGETPVENATVRLDGEAVNTTDEDGHGTVVLPDSAGPAELEVERGPVEGADTVDVAQPEVAFTSPALFPGFPAPVQVSADGAPIEGATVELEDGSSATTGSDGRASVWLPLENEATATGTVGEETTTATAGNLYQRLAILAVLVPGFVIGGLITYLRLVAAREKRRGGALDELFVGLADALGGLARAVGLLPRALAGLLESLSAVRFPSLPRLSVPQSGPGLGLSSIGSSVFALNRTLTSLPSIGSIRGSSGRTRGSLLENSPLDTVFGDDDDRDDEEPSAGVGGPALAAEPLEPRRPRAEIRAAWHAFLDRLEVDDRETATPGTVARRALAAGFPADSVRTLLALFRDVEYGGREPSPERVRTARETAAELQNHDSDEEGSQ
ncbi:DUF4129 domain-containing protein [Salinadaptatus halalkaliphilus]|uniref:DUF4129 domain-containing protein n=1 Tax=Salinadaptatus halalkaliphilus TaxID=2419781 RepID=A0A4S3TR61_9EURY|nr:DUF4129 domain-containing protein [Salinadaptatus halalkaliphilus]THE66816.1 DUF4129 domain-containing protein [Salinadaptatus halalkaliphilus]